MDKPSNNTSAPKADASAHEPDTALRRRLLAKAVEYEILPRLMLAHRMVQDSPTLAQPGTSAISPTEVFEFARLVRQADDDKLREEVARLRRRGVSMAGILMDLLAPVARHLGVLWERDLCDFQEVTVALGRLHQLLRENSPLPPIDPASRPQGERRPSILLAPCPGEQHTFGLSLVAEFFVQADWNVSAGFMSEDASPTRLVKDQWFDVVGLSLGSTSLLPALLSSLQDLRKASVNPQIFIILGGPIFALHPEYAAQLPVDAVVTDGSAAPAMAAQLLARLETKV